MRKSGMNSENILVLVVIIISLVLVSTGCSKSDKTSTPPANEVYIQNFAFTPSTITITTNTTITWTNKDASAHTVTSNDGTFDSGSIASGVAYARKFTVAGTYNYYCSIHPTMLGKVIVQ
jgi:plastocyanin